jgi:hypothetical protein
LERKEGAGTAAALLMSLERTIIRSFEQEFEKSMAFRSAIDISTVLDSLHRVVFPAGACGCRARGLEREVRASGRYTRKRKSKKDLSLFIPDFHFR